MDWLGILISALMSVLILLVQHLLPWPRLIGQELPPRIAAYVMGVLALLFPLSILYAVWEQWVALLALWTVVIAGGVAVMLAYAVESWLEWRIRATEAEEREEEITDEILERRR